MDEKRRMIMSNEKIIGLSACFAILLSLIFSGCDDKKQWFAPPAAPPSGFALVSPADGSKGVVLTPLLTWNDSSDETGYTIQIATDSTFASIVYQDATLAANTVSHTVPSGVLSAATPYYWRVLATGAGGQTIASGTPFSFTPIATWAISFQSGGGEYKEI